MADNSPRDQSSHPDKHSPKQKSEIRRWRPFSSSQRILSRIGQRRDFVRWGLHQPSDVLFRALLSINTHIDALAQILLDRWGFTIGFSHFRI
jgi:hypothetical protein